VDDEGLRHSLLLSQMLVLGRWAQRETRFLSTRICKGQAQGSANRRRGWWWLGADQTRDYGVLVLDILVLALCTEY
jgi:hypothetical protein